MKKNITFFLIFLCFYTGSTHGMQRVLKEDYQNNDDEIILLGGLCGESDGVIGNITNGAKTLGRAAISPQIRNILIPCLLYAIMFFCVDAEECENYLFYLILLTNFFVEFMPEHPVLTILMNAERLLNYFDVLRENELKDFVSRSCSPNNKESKLIRRVLKKVFGYEKELPVFNMSCHGRYEVPKYFGGGQMVSSVFSRAVVFVDFDYLKKVYNAVSVRKFVVAHEAKHVANHDMLKMYVFLLGANVVIPYVFRFTVQGLKKLSKLVSEKFFRKCKKRKQRSWSRHIANGAISIGTCCLCAYAQNSIIFLLFQGLRRYLERQADIGAVVALGSKEGALKYFEKSLCEGKISWALGRLAEKIESWLGSHPTFRERIAYIEEL